ncbi:unnamed protein product [Amoebophrya sp. A120]|nr:unnamed protein product [Amoebophrya sp. A120]|eukprot:GSA120T00014640001.1
MDFNYVSPPIGRVILEKETRDFDFKSLLSDLISGAAESVKLDLRGTTCERWESIDAADQQSFFEALAQNAKLPPPSRAGEVRSLRRLQLLLMQEDFHDRPEQDCFDEEIMKSHLTEFFQHASALESLEVFFGGNEEGSIRDFVWNPLSMNAHVAETLKFLSVVGGNQGGLGTALPKFPRLEELRVFDWTNEVTQQRLGAEQYNFAPSGAHNCIHSDNHYVAPLGDEALAAIQDFLRTFVNRVRKLLFWPMVRPTNLQTLTVTPAVLHSLRDAIAASAAPIYRIRIWGIFEDRQQYVVTSSLQHRDAGEQYYKEHKTKDARTAEKPGMTVYQQVLLDLKHVLENKRAPSDDHALFDVWFMFGGFANDADATLMKHFLRTESLPMLEKIGVARFSATKTLALQSGAEYTTWSEAPLPWQGEAAVTAAQRLCDEIGSSHTLPLKLDLFGGDTPVTTSAWAASPDLAAKLLVDPASSPMRRKIGPDRGFSEVEDI